MSSIAIFHHHLLPGGVTTVIRDAVKSIGTYLSEIDTVYLVMGREESVASNKEKIEAYIREQGGLCALEVIVVPEIGYCEEEELLRAAPDSSSVKKVLLEKLGIPGCIWWVHNYHLGKNPVFTDAVLDIAYNCPDQRLLLQIHDFPECARFVNLKYLNSFITHNPYPIRDNVMYAVINSRDKDLLNAAGIPEKSVVFLKNAIPPFPINKGDKKDIQNKLYDNFGSRFPGAHQNGRLLFYPVRTIRRKNVLEMGLLTRLLPEKVNLFVTLPGISSRELAYSGIIEKAFKEGLIPGYWGIGMEVEKVGISFDNAISSADVVVSSAVQEGFGYLFINALQWGIPLFARYLDVLDGVSHVFDHHPHHFYDSVKIPLTGKLRSQLKDEYYAKIESLLSIISAEIESILFRDIEKILQKDTIDFSYLSIQTQYEILEGLKDREFAGEIAALNKGKLSILTDLFHQDPSARQEEIDSLFGYRSFGQDFGALLKTFDSPRSDEQQDNEARIQGNMSRQFAKTEYIRLLYDFV